MAKHENIAVVRAFFDEVLNAHNNDRTVIGRFLCDDFTQHCDGIADGIDGFSAWTDSFFALQPEMEIIKVFANDHDEVAVFFKCTFGTSDTVNKVVDIFRLRDGKLAEHWAVAELNIENMKCKSGREMFSSDALLTPTPAEDAQNDNIAKVIAFNEEVFTAHNNSRALLDAFMRDDYMQHNPGAGDGKEGFVGMTGFFFTLEPKMVISKAFSNEDGEVAVFFKCICRANGMVNKVCDIYRLNDGKLAEHWDIVEHDVKDSPLPNGKSIF